MSQAKESKTQPNPSSFFNFLEEQMDQLKNFTPEKIAAVLENANALDRAALVPAGWHTATVASGRIHKGPKSKAIKLGLHLTDLNRTATTRLMIGIPDGSKRGLVSLYERDLQIWAAIGKITGVVASKPLGFCSLLRRERHHFEVKIEHERIQMHGGARWFNRVDAVRAGGEGLL